MRKRPPAHAVKIDYQSGVAIVQGGKVCTPDRCDDLGPNVRAAVDAADKTVLVRATADREAVVIGATVWSRGHDAKLVLPNWDGGLESIRIIGTRLAVGYSCSEYCAQIGRVFDSRGRLVTRKTFFLGSWDGIVPEPIDLAADRFVVFSAFGHVTLIAGGKPVASLALGNGMDVRVVALALESDSIAMEVCTTAGCELGYLRIGDQGSPPLELVVVRHLPKCSVEPD